MRTIEMRKGRSQPGGPALAALLVLILAFLTVPLTSPAWTGKVVGIQDGDTITVLDEEDKTTTRIRVYGIDCPESGQAFGKKAKEFTSKMVFRKSVEIHPVEQDRYGRLVADVHVNGASLAEELVRAGLAWVYTRYCTSLVTCPKLERLENEARTAKRGLWADKNPMPPWDYRRR